MRGGLVQGVSVLMKTMTGRQYRNTYAQGRLVPLDLWPLDSVAVSLAVLVVICVIL